MYQRGDLMKINFGYFQIQKWVLQTVSAEKVDQINWVICLVSIFPSRVMVCELSKKVNVLLFCADLSNESNSARAIYIYGSESSPYTLSDNGMVYRGLSHRS